MGKQKKPWIGKWKIEKELSGGGQCDNYLVHSTDQNIKGEFVLKVIKDSSKLERRSRFYREVHNYIALNHSQIPQIVDHNCNETPEIEQRLYFVYPYINGLSLEERISNNGPMALNEAVGLVVQLADILQFCHNNDIVHRDIKPDNIILEENSDNAPQLIDFGLSARDSDAELHESGAMQLGNRFLYLPELKHDNGNKRDKRSDITYLVGILFYVLTGKYPSHFMDEEGRYPHQRVSLETMITGVEAVKINLLKCFFDKGFQVQLNRRFQDIEELKELLNKITVVNDKTDNDYISLIMSMADVSKVKAENELKDMLPKIRQYFGEIPNRNKFPNVEVAISGPQVLPHWDPICIAGHYYITEKFERKITQTYMFKVYPNGIDFILSIFAGKNESIIQRFQDPTQLNEETVQNIEDVIWKSYALLIKKDIK